MWKQADCKEIDDDDNDEVMKLEGRYGTNMVKLTISIRCPRLNVHVFGLQFHAGINMVFSVFGMDTWGNCIIGTTTDEMDGSWEELLSFRLCCAWFVGCRDNVLIVYDCLIFNKKHLKAWKVCLVIFRVTLSL